jgi:hypothetical protein
MNKQAKVGVSAIACLALAGFLCVAPPAASKANAAGTQQSASEAHTVSGKVTSIGKTSFTLTVASAQMNKSSSPDSNAKSMTFQVDSNTTIDGNLQVGVDADVTYRIDAGQYVAINVRVGQ